MPGRPDGTAEALTRCGTPRMARSGNTQHSLREAWVVGKATEIADLSALTEPQKIRGRAYAVYREQIP
jgi:hypothetical protein